MQPPGGGGPATFHLNNGWGPDASSVFTYGRTEDEVLIGDWDGNGTDTLTLRRGNTFYVSNSQRGGEASKVFTYGRRRRRRPRALLRPRHRRGLRR